METFTLYQAAYLIGYFMVVTAIFCFCYFVLANPEALLIKK